MFGRLAGLAIRAPRRVVGVAVLFFVVAAAFGGSVVDRLDSYGADDPASESVRARVQLERATGVRPDVGLVALIELPDGILARASRARVRSVVRDLRSDPAVGPVTSYYDARRGDMLSRDGRATYVVARFRALGDREISAASRRLQTRLGERPGVRLGGPGIALAQANDTVEADLRRAELISFPLLFLLSLLFFRGLVAALLPVFMGALAITATFVGLRVATEVTSISVFSINLVTALGLGMAIDQSLFMVSRYREELATVGCEREALQRTMATAGRAVLFSSLIVAAAMASLLIFPQRFVYSMGVGGLLVALIACGVALIVLPAVLALLGARVDAWSPRRLRRAAWRDARPAQSGAWYRLSRCVTRRAGSAAIVAAAALFALAVPFLGVRFTYSDASVLPRDASARQVHDALQTRFQPDRQDRIYVAAERDGSVSPSRLASVLRRQPGVVAVTPPQHAGRRLARIDVIADSPIYSRRREDLVERIRALPAASSARVGGLTAEFVDLKASLRHHLPVALAIMAATTFVLLFAMTGSIVIPVKALLMSSLTLAAACGFLVLVFQDGRFERVLGFTSTGALDAAQPVILLAVVFGLATDYGVFLLTRIKEAHDDGVPTGEAVAVGLERTGRIVTAAALLFCIAIGAFATSRILLVKELALGTAVGVLIDATLVRALLVPSLMQLLGGRNWWAPGPLRRLHARVGRREAREPLPAASAGEHRIAGRV